MCVEILTLPDESVPAQISLGNCGGWFRRLWPFTCPYPEVIEKSGLAAFEAQNIPMESALLGIDGYKAFQ
jgi:hypothetical protein